jgi:hypothetical protein
VLQLVSLHKRGGVLSMTIAFVQEQRRERLLVVAGPANQDAHVRNVATVLRVRERDRHRGRLARYPQIVLRGCVTRRL